MTIKEQILSELNNTKIPNLKFLFSLEVLDIALPLLRELLEQEKQDFENKLKTPNEKITFEIFDDFSHLDYFWGLLNHLENVKSSDKIREITQTFEPEYMDFGNYIAYNKRYFDMLVYCRENTKLDEEQCRILDQSIKSYKVRGIDLEEKKQDSIKLMRKKLSNLSQKFGNNLLDSHKEFLYNLLNDEYLKEFPKDDLEQAKKRASDLGKSGYLFDSSSGSYLSIMKYCSSSEVRRDFFIAKHSYASSGKYDNRQIVLDILKLRNEKSKILGFKNYAELSLVFKMAETPEQIVSLLQNITKKAKEKALLEIQELKNHFNLTDLNTWDTAYYSRKLKEEKYALDEAELKKYFEFENTLKELFGVVKKLYNIDMKEISGEKYNDDVRYYEVYKDDKFISYFIGDYFYNPDKRSGAWADLLRCHDESSKHNKLVVNVCNFTKGENHKTLLTLHDVETMFHEFGHAIHEMLSVSKYSDLSGFNVEWDFVELPSQLLENWCSDNETITYIGKHFENGQPIPESYLQSLDKLKTYGTGNFTVRQNEFALLDMLLHIGDAPDTVEKLDEKTLSLSRELQVFELSDEYKMYSSFSHIFDGGYGAGYYSYMWAEIIEAEVFAEFKRNGVYDKKTATRFLNTILGQGSKKDASDLFRDFMGRDVDIKAFFDRKGF